VKKAILAGLALLCGLTAAFAVTFLLMGHDTKGVPFSKFAREDAMFRCMVGDPMKYKRLKLQKDGTYRATGGDISLRWSWHRRDYLCVYHDGKGHTKVLPAPKSDDG
jgi:hypothetical protein